MSQRLGDLLVKQGVITAEQLSQALQAQRVSSARLTSILVKLGFVTHEDVTNFLSRQYGVPAINLAFVEIDPTVVNLIPYEAAKRYEVLPLTRVSACLTLAMVDPTNVFAIDDIKFMTGLNVEPVVASETSDIWSRFKVLWRRRDRSRTSNSHEAFGNSAMPTWSWSHDEEELTLSTVEKAAEDAPIVKLVNIDSWPTR